MSVTAALLPGYPLGNVQNVLKKKLQDVPLGNVQLFWGGQAEMMTESFGYMFGALILAILLVYMLMAALFESLFSPFIIMFSLPMALIGAILALVITGETMSIVAMIGFIMLMGLVTKNAILLVDYTNTLREQGLERTQAILRGRPDEAPADPDDDIRDDLRHAADRPEARPRLGDARTDGDRGHRRTDRVDAADAGHHPDALHDLGRHGVEAPGCQARGCSVTACRSRASRLRNRSPTKSRSRRPTRLRWTAPITETRWGGSWTPAPFR